MNRKQIQHKLKDHTLCSHDREVLLQTLHYLEAEGLYSTSSSKRSPKSSNYTHKKHSSSNSKRSSKGSHTSSS